MTSKSRTTTPHAVYHLARRCIPPCVYVPALFAISPGDPLARPTGVMRVYVPPGEEPASAEEETVAKEDDPEPAVPAAAEDAAVTVEEAVTTPDETTTEETADVDTTAAVEEEEQEASPAPPAEDAASPAADSAESTDAGECDCGKGWGLRVTCVAERVTDCVEFVFGACFLYRDSVKGAETFCVALWVCDDSGLSSRVSLNII